MSVSGLLIWFLGHLPVVVDFCIALGYCPYMTSVTSRAPLTFTFWNRYLRPYPCRPLYWEHDLPLEMGMSFQDDPLDMWFVVCAQRKYMSGHQKAEIGFLNASGAYEILIGEILCFWLSPWFCGGGGFVYLSRLDDSLIFILATLFPDTVSKASVSVEKTVCEMQRRENNCMTYALK